MYDYTYTALPTQACYVIWSLYVPKSQTEGRKPRSHRNIYKITNPKSPKKLRSRKYISIIFMINTKHYQKILELLDSLSPEQLTDLENQIVRSDNEGLSLET